MPLTFDPEFAALAGPAAALLSKMSTLPAGDVEGRRAIQQSLFQPRPNASESSPGSVPFSESVKCTVYHARNGTDANPVTIYAYTPKPALTMTAENDKDKLKSTAAILHFHGGGYIMGSAAEQRIIPSTLAHLSHTPIFDVEYRLAPEHPYPAPLDDAYTALTWLIFHAEELGIDSRRIAVMGSSSGGGIAAALALLARDRGLSPGLARQILIYPMMDDRNVAPIQGIEDVAVWKSIDNETGWNAYLGEPAGDVPIYAAPARTTDLAGLPDAYIEVGMLDIFRDECLSYVQRLAQAGVQTEFHLWPGVPHGFEMAQSARVTRAAMEMRVRAMTSF
ncbi:alpha/beta hydrolase fold-domain-containing protein [Aspergillus multicolor]|uniref:alpha/beta hydrolase n=1 Tax=Aspergillus multicolor TaxID=41759 RepID=UPI003CCD62AE